MLQAFASFARICVPIFFFLGGYGLYKRLESGKFSLSDSIISLYKQYWKVFVIFIPIAFCFFSRTGENVNYLTSRYVITEKDEFITELLSNFIGYSCSFNSEWWFFSVYLCLLPLGCLFYTTIENHRSFLKDAFILISLSMILYNVFPNLANMEMFSNIDNNIFFKRFFLLPDSTITFFEGIVFAKYNALATLKKKLESIPLNKILCVIGCATIFWCRTYILTQEIADLIYVSFFIAFVSILIDCLAIIKTIFSFLGKHSTNMWYVHSFYCYYFLEVTKIVYCTQNVWVDWLILILMSLATSVLLEFIYKQINTMWNKMISKTDAITES